MTKRYKKTRWQLAQAACTIKPKFVCLQKAQTLNHGQLHQHSLSSLELEVEGRKLKKCQSGKIQISSNCKKFTFHGWNWFGSSLLLQNFESKNAGRLCDWESHHDEHGQHCSTIPQVIAAVHFHLIITCPPSAQTNTKLSMAYSTHTWTEWYFNKWSSQFVSVPGKKLRCLACGGPRRLLAQLQLQPTSQSSAGRAFARTWAIDLEDACWNSWFLAKQECEQQSLSFLTLAFQNQPKLHASFMVIDILSTFALFCPATFDIRQHCCKAPPWKPWKKLPDLAQRSLCGMATPCNSSCCGAHHFKKDATND